MSAEKRLTPELVRGWLKPANAGKAFTLSRIGVSRFQSFVSKSKYDEALVLRIDNWTKGQEGPATDKLYIPVDDPESLLRGRDGTPVLLDGEKVEARLWCSKTGKCGVVFKMHPGALLADDKGAAQGGGAAPSHSKNAKPDAIGEGMAWGNAKNVAASLMHTALGAGALKARSLDEFRRYYAGLAAWVYSLTPESAQEHGRLAPEGDGEAGGEASAPGDGDGSTAPGVDDFGPVDDGAPVDDDLPF